MIVEMFGVPGGGKTTLMRAIAATMPGARVVEVSGRAQVGWGVVCFAVRHPISFLLWMGALVMSANGLFRYKLGLLVRSMAVRALAERMDTSVVICIDEGLLQRILTLFDKPLSHRALHFLLTRTPLPDAVISVRGGDFSRFRSAENRHNSPRFAQGEAGLTAWMEAVRINAQAVDSQLSSVTKVISCTRGQPDADPAWVRVRLQDIVIY